MMRRHASPSVLLTASSKSEKNTLSGQQQRPLAGKETEHSEYNRKGFKERFSSMPSRIYVKIPQETHLSEEPVEI